MAPIYEDDITIDADACNEWEELLEEEGEDYPIDEDAEDLRDLRPSDDDY